ncbi:MAG: transposase, partial [Bacteroidetes bacterium]|nr:transposase [Bacteroidota bacterium]
SGNTLVLALTEIINWRGKPLEIRCDNGPEFLSHTFTQYCEKTGITIKHIQPGKPTQNAYIERFNRSYREDILDAYLFDSIHHLRTLSQDWMEEYNHHHLHQSLNNLSPIKYLELKSNI